METLCLPVNAADPTDAASQKAIELAADMLRQGRLVAFPTETVYGLGANAMDAQAVAGVFTAKQRPAWDPVIVHIAHAGGLAAITAPLTSAVQHRVDLLAAAFWPGPLTLLLPRAATLPQAVTAGGPLVGIRWPAHPVALELIRQAGVAIAAPSANRFGHISPTRAQHVLDDLDGRIDAVLDGGPARVGVESTVLDVTAQEPVIYRPGGVTRPQLESVLGCVVRWKSDILRADHDASGAPAPGVGIRHYAPGVRLVLAGSQQEMSDLVHDGQRWGVMLPQGWLPPAGAHSVFHWGGLDDAKALASGLYEGLRWLEASGVDSIVCPVPAASLGAEALLDRLRKAAMR